MKLTYKMTADEFYKGYNYKIQKNTLFPLHLCRYMVKFFKYVTEV